MRSTASKIAIGMRSRVIGLSLVASLFTVGAMAEVVAEADSKSKGLDLGCGAYQFVDLTRIDYRLKDGDPAVEKGVWDLDHYHTEPARNELLKIAPHANTVMGNLDFTLRHSPNHHEALRLLIQYELRGGNLLKFPSARCYLDWAHRFASDDVTVVLYGGNYFWKKGDRQLAKSWYEKALELEPGLAEGHYNLGLLYADEKNMEKAREHARAAYAAGFPLPGLKNKLARAGYPLN